ncbi:MAG: HigA family addiction module antidote protein [Zoogloeaceae bacterium]|jgi:addiction module HigA family antidote|nr:HigA family addiction module antidote protein [Zoogloeaceae bacterium]
MIRTHLHPGAILREMVTEPPSLSVAKAANQLAVPRTTLSRILNGKGSINADFALRLEQAGVGSARFWINLQANHDLWQALQHQPPRPQSAPPGRHGRE